MRVPHWLRALTFAVHHNPNCPEPFQVRLCGDGRGRIDNLPLNETQDRVGHGETLAGAARNALEGASDGTN